MRDHKKKWGNTINDEVFCENPQVHNDIKSDVWGAKCEACGSTFLACSDCVMEGDCICPACRGSAFKPHTIQDILARQIQEDIHRERLQTS